MRAEASATEETAGAIHGQSNIGRLHNLQFRSCARRNISYGPDYMYMSDTIEGRCEFVLYKYTNITRISDKYKYKCGFLYRLCHCEDSDPYLVEVIVQLSCCKAGKNPGKPGISFINCQKNMTTNLEKSTDVFPGSRASSSSSTSRASSSSSKSRASSSSSKSRA